MGEKFNISNLNLYYGDFHALKDVDLTINEKEITAFIGPSGCGKSTTASLLMRFCDAAAGHIYMDGKDYHSMKPEELRKHIAMVPQQVNLFSGTIRENLLLADPDADDQTLMEAVKEAGLLKFVQSLEKGLNSDVGNAGASLSGGQRQRVGIAQALLGNPPFLIFDEPTVGLDPEERIHFRNLFSRTAEEHLVLLSTHIIEDVQSVCDQIVVIHHGTILFTGTPEQLIQSATGHVGVFWEKDETLEQGLHITARVNTSQGIRCRAVADKLPSYAQAEEPSLEDAYLYLISREAAQ